MTGDRPKEFLRLTQLNILCDHKEPREDSHDISIDERDLLTERDREDRACSVSAHTRQSLNSFKLIWHDPIMTLNDLSRPLL
jgi:hypothetical protein